MICTDLKVLRQVSKPFTGSKGELHKLIALLDQELTKSTIPGVGLSAIQIVIPLQVAIIRTVDLDLDLYNTKIVDCGCLFRFKGEGCLSIPNTFKDTWRFENITIENGDGSIIKLTGYNSIVIQHELCHFNGLLFIDYAAN